MKKITAKDVLLTLLKIPVCILCLASVIPVLYLMLFGSNDLEKPQPASDIQLMENFDALVNDAVLDAKEGAHSVRKRFWIADDAETLPRRDDSKYGTASEASQLQWLLDEAAPLLEGQELAFHTGIEIRKGAEITYYLDESIFAITWQQVIDRVVYTISEVKISDGSQLRRHLADGYYVAKSLYSAPRLAAQAGAVIAVSGDHFRGRNHGIVVYDGEVKRFTGEYTVDSCFFDTEGNLILKPKESFSTKAELEAFIAENNIKFSASFGPVLIMDGVRCDPKRYILGEINDNYPRCAIAQKDELHYLLFTVNGTNSYLNYPTIAMFTDQIEKFNVQQAYCLDGGQTGSIAMKDKLMNPFEYRAGPRAIGDIIFFATAVPNKK